MRYGWLLYWLVIAIRLDLVLMGPDLTACITAIPLTDYDFDSLPECLLSLEGYL